MLNKIKKNKVYIRCKGIIRYSKRNNVNIFNAAKNVKVCTTELKDILEHVDISNIGKYPFWYSIDTSIIVDNQGKKIIDNIPVDYSYIMNNFDESNDTAKIIVKYVKKINDSRVKLEKPKNLKEALQSILFWNSLLWQTGHTLVGLGRLDKVLDKYEVEYDSEMLIMSFLETLHMAYDYKSSYMRGDTGQIIILGGSDDDKSYFCNEYTYIFIKCMKKLKYPDPKLLVRCNSNMPIELMRLALQCNATGIGSPLYCNDDRIIPLLMDFGYEKKDAYNYGVSACWEPLSIGNSLEQNNLDNIEFGKCLNETILDKNFIKSESIEDVLEIYIKKLSANCNQIKKRLNKFEWVYDPLLSMLMGLDKDISLGGTKYNNYGILSIGISSAVDSILNIERYVFDENTYTLSEIQQFILDNNVSLFKENKNGFGTDSLKAIDLTNWIIEQTEKQFENYKNRYGGSVKFGLSSPAYILGAKKVGATLDGRMAGQPFRTHISRDKNNSITDIIRFESKLKISGRSSNANVVDIIVQPTLFKDNINKFADFIMGGIFEGMFQLQLNILSYEQLVDAKAHPEKYIDLIVRVWGFSAYFNDLPEEYKDNIIRRAKEMQE